MNENPNSLSFRCEECKLVFPGDMRVGVIEEHWETLHGEPPAHVELVYKTPFGYRVYAS